MLKVGTWKGCLTDWGAYESESGAKGVALTFAVEVEGELEEGHKVLFLHTDKVKQGSIKTLYELGFNGDIDALAKGREAKALDSGKNVYLTCAEETYNGKTSVKVQWVNLNPPGPKKLDAKAGAGLLGEFKADFLAFKPVGATKKLELG